MFPVSGGGSEQLEAMSLALLGQIQDGKVERIRPNSSQSIECYNRECPSISGFVASGVVGIERSKVAPLWTFPPTRLSNIQPRRFFGLNVRDSTIVSSSSISHLHSISTLRSGY